MAMAIMMVPMMTVQTICELEKYGASRRLAPSSMAMTDMPEKKAVTYKNSFLPMTGACFASIKCTSGCGIRTMIPQPEPLWNYFIPAPRPGPS